MYDCVFEKSHEVFDLSSALFTFSMFCLDVDGVYRGIGCIHTGAHVALISSAFFSYGPLVWCTTLYRRFICVVYMGGHLVMHYTHDTEYSSSCTNSKIRETKLSLVLEKKTRLTPLIYSALRRISNAQADVWERKKKTKKTEQIPKIPDHIPREVYEQRCGREAATEQAARPVNAKKYQRPVKSPKVEKTHLVHL